MDDASRSQPDSATKAKEEAKSEQGRHKGNQRKAIQQEERLQRSARPTTTTQTIIPGWADWFLGWSRAGRRAAKRKAREIGVARVAHDTFRKIDAMWNYGVIQLLGDEVTKPTT